MKRAIIFDFDGTLVDIEPIFYHIVNKLAPEFGYPPLLLEDIPKLKKLHLREFLWKRLSWRFFLLPFILKRGREEYHRLIGQVPIFSGTETMLQTLRQHGYRLGIVSSSRTETIDALVKRLDLPFEFIVHCSLFNKGTILKRTLREQGLALSDSIYIGDEVRDIEACRKIGLDIVAVTWGLNDRFALQATGAPLVDTRDELLRYLLKQ